MGTVRLVCVYDRENRLGLSFQKTIRITTLHVLSTHRSHRARSLRPCCEALLGRRRRRGSEAWERQLETASVTREGKDDGRLEDYEEWCVLSLVLRECATGIAALLLGGTLERDCGVVAWVGGVWRWVWRVR